MSIKTLKTALTKRGIKTKPLSEFYDDDTRQGLWLISEDYEDLPIFNNDALFNDPDERVWVMGVLNKVNKVIESHDCFAEPYDAGTLHIHSNY